MGPIRSLSEIVISLSQVEAKVSRVSLPVGWCKEISIPIDKETFRAGVIARKVQKYITVY